MATFEPERCYSCKKLFCCVDCCVNHIRNKHPGRESQCSLCRYEPLIIGKINHPELLCHLVFNHLPLYCRICGKFFLTSEELETIGKCICQPIIRIEPPTIIESEKSILNLTPSQASPAATVVTETSDTSSNNHSNHEYFISYPEFTRNTSTPMQIGLNKHSTWTTNIIFKDRPILSSFKTINNNNNNNSSSSKKKPLTDFNETAIRSAEEFDQNENFNNFSQRKLASMQEELNENQLDKEEILRTCPDVGGTSTTRRDYEKKVRFSDEFHMKPLDDTDMEEFFDARQSMRDDSTQSVENINEKYSDNFTSINKDESLKIDIKSTESSSSRLVMMILMENNNDGNSTRTSLGSFMNSGLKQLDSLISQSSRSPNNNNDGFSLISVDNYTKVSTLECFNIPEKNCNKSDNITEQNTNFNGGGIFSAFTNAVKNAFKNFSGISRTNQVKSLKETNCLMIKTTSKKQDENIPPCRPSRPAKRSRDEIDIDSVNGDLPDCISQDTQFNDTNTDDIRSPLQKRPRGWYKQIRGREPIARMKKSIPSITPRGVSLETQCFQQGSLSVGNIIIPLPARAHQSTQTE